MTVVGFIFHHQVAQLHSNRATVLLRLDHLDEAHASAKECIRVDQDWFKVSHVTCDSFWMLDLHTTNCQFIYQMWFWTQLKHHIATIHISRQSEKFPIIIELALIVYARVWEGVSVRAEQWRWLSQIKWLLSYRLIFNGIFFSINSSCMFFFSMYTFIIILCVYADSQRKSCPKRIEWIRWTKEFRPYVRPPLTNVPSRDLLKFIYSKTCRNQISSSGCRISVDSNVNFWASKIYSGLLVILILALQTLQLFNVNFNPCTHKFV